ncbi:MAG: hypothetical protein H6623_03265 [Bdellovibrionaceae bacterium]|nr:hypothetical protein [Pseudobdellovibrionaceae bacterium]
MKPCVWPCCFGLFIFMLSPVVQATDTVKARATSASENSQNHKQQPPSTLNSVREAISKKDMDVAVALLQKMYPKQLQRGADIKRVTQWFHIFLYEDTVTSFEGALDLVTKQEAGAEEAFQKALRKEPHNRLINQTYVTYLIDHEKKDEAMTALANLTSKYPYFKVYTLYRAYIAPEQGFDGASCLSEELNNEEKDFCRYLLLRHKKPIANKKKDIEQLEKIHLPDAQFYLWEMTSNKEYLKNYLAKCRGLSDKQKRAYSVIPGVCRKQKEIETLLMESASLTE